MTDDEKSEAIHRFPVSVSSKGIQLKMQPDPGNPEAKHMEELFRELSGSYPSH